MAAGAALFLLGGCAEAWVPEAPTTSEEAPVSAGPPAPNIGLWAGEQVTAEVVYKGVTVGEYRLWVAPPCLAEGRPVLPVVSTARRVGIYGAFDDSGGEAMSWLDPTSGRPVANRSRVESRVFIRRYLVSFLEGHYRVALERQSKRSDRTSHTDRLQQAPPHVPIHDVHSALGLLRVWAGTPGKRGSLHVVFGSRLHRVDVQVAERERITVGGSTFDAIRIDGTDRVLRKDLTVGKKVRNLALWVSDEPARLPLKAQIEARKGIVEAELTSYSQSPPAPAPTAACDSPPETN